MRSQLFKRAIIIVLDSLGVGELPDAYLYGDEGSNTLANTAAAVGGLNLPNFQRLGLGNIVKVKGVSSASRPLACYGKMAEKSAGKDTTTGHWEMMGLYLEKPFPTYPNGFPPRIIEAFEKKIKTKILGNKPASGTEIIQELGEEHLITGYPIVYTSADSVFQVAAHEEVVPVKKLYRICQMAREILKGEDAVGRVIARPFIGQPGSFSRTERRKDFSLPPPSKTALDYAHENGIPVMGVGKIGQIFVGRGISKTFHITNNQEGLIKTIDLMKKIKRGIVFTNLVDFDMLWGHRNDPQAYAKGLEEVDSFLPQIFNILRQDDVLFFTADHGCDPTTKSTDHSREYVPLLVLGLRIRQGVNLGIRQTFSDLGKTLSELLGFEAKIEGKSFASEILKQP